MTMVDVTGISAEEGDPVEIFGKTRPVSDLAVRSGTIPYEILTSVPERVKRVYLHE
jgi:alanine racemase